MRLFFVLLLSGQVWAQAVSPVPAPAAPETPTSLPLKKVNPGKVRRVAELLGLDGESEEDILVRLIDEFLALKGA